MSLTSVLAGRVEWGSEPVPDPMSEAYGALIRQIGEDPARQGLRDTPKRAAKAWRHLTQGYEQDVEALVNGAVFDSDNDEMVLVKNIEVYSLCEHHLLPIIGHCHVAYIPNGTCTREGCKFRKTSPSRSPMRSTAWSTPGGLPSRSPPLTCA